MLKRQFCRSVERYYVREYWSEEYAERDNYRGYFPFNEPCTVLWWKGLLPPPCRKRQIEKALVLSPRLAFRPSSPGAGLCIPRAAGRGTSRAGAALAAGAGSAAARGLGARGACGGLEGPRRGLVSEATMFLIRGGTRHGFLVSVQNESRGRPGLCSGAGWRSPPRVGVRAASARRPRSRAPPTVV